MVMATFRFYYFSKSFVKRFIVENIKILKQKYLEFFLT